MPRSAREVLTGGKRRGPRKKDHGATFDSALNTDRKPRDKSANRGQMACVWFGLERLSQLKAELPPGTSLSSYICGLVDADAARRKG